MSEVFFISPNNPEGSPRVSRRIEQRLSDWVRLVTKVVLGPDGDQQKFHFLGQQDYVAVLAVTKDRKLVVVQQYRPAVEAVTTELPSGLREANEEADVTAARELEEETGFVPIRPLELLGCVRPDTGRLENSLWCFFAPDVRRAQDWTPENGIQTFLLDPAEVVEQVQNGSFNHALHIAVIYLAVARGLLPELVKYHLPGLSGAQQ